MKDLDQASRATLRKYGVRFGAYHIYVPALLKPAARALASLLWAQKQDDVDFSALSGAQHLAGSGRTSFPVDKQLNRDAYRVLGYKQCGERAVRVDILERLADLIRPALSWRETSPGEKPAGAFDGRGFVVTQAMTSLTGSAGEDFASILRALGYRMERRPPPPPKPAPAAVESVVAETSANEAVAEAPALEASVSDMAAEVALEATALEEVVSAEPPVAIDCGEAGASEATASSPSAALLPEVVFSATANEAAPVDASSVEASSVEPTPSEPASTETTPADAPQDQTAAASEAVAPETPAAPELVEVWRPGGRSEERRPRHDRNRHRADEGAQTVAAGEAGEGVKHERHRRGRRERPDFRKLRSDAPAEGVAATPAADGAAVREPHEERAHPPRERFHGKGRDREKGAERDKGKFGGGREKNGRENHGRDKGGRDKGGRDKRDSGPSHRQFASSASPRDRDRPIDPNSPFAKLAALKEQLSANRKD
jgi:ATP-dependent RNA helicase SUPV3L1/SUV3